MRNTVVFHVKCGGVLKKVLKIDVYLDFILAEAFAFFLNCSLFFFWTRFWESLLVGYELDGLLQTGSKFCEIFLKEYLVFFETNL